jgi:hypothetical protein
LVTFAKWLQKVTTKSVISSHVQLWRCDWQRKVFVKFHIQHLCLIIPEYFDFDYNWRKNIEILYALDALMAFLFRYNLDSCEFVNYEYSRKNSWWSLHKKWDTVFLSLPAEAKNICRSKYISPAQSNPKSLLRSRCMKMTVCSVIYQLTQLSPDSDC